MEWVQRKAIIGSGFRKNELKRLTAEQQQKRGNEAKVTTCLEYIKWCRVIGNLGRL